MNTKSTIKRGGAFALAEIMLIICVIALLSALTMPKAFAGLQSQTDTNSLVVNSTNTFLLSVDISGSFTNGEQSAGQSLINCSKAADVWLECGGVFTNTTAGASNITFRIAASISGSMWTNSYATVTVTVPASSTNYASGNLKLTGAPPILGLRAIENPNLGGVTARGNSLYLKAFTKDGI